MRRLAPFLLVGFILSSSARATSGLDLLQDACNLGIDLACQISDLAEAYQNNIQDFTRFINDTLPKHLKGIAPDLDSLIAYVGEKVDLPEDVYKEVETFVNLPKTAKEDVQQFIEEINKQVDRRSEAFADELIEFLQSNPGDVEVDGETKDAAEYLKEVYEDYRKIPDACKELQKTTELENPELKTECETALAAKKGKLEDALKKVQEAVREAAKKTRQLASEAESNEKFERTAVVSTTIAAAQKSAERASEASTQTLDLASQASQEAKRLKDNAQNAVSTRAAVQVLAEGVAKLMEKNITTLALVQQNLAELARQNVYNNQQLAQISEQVVKSSADEYKAALAEAEQEASFYFAQAKVWTRQGERLREEVKTLFDTSCLKKPNWATEGCGD